MEITNFRNHGKSLEIKHLVLRVESAGRDIGGVCIYAQPSHSNCHADEGVGLSQTSRHPKVLVFIVAALAPLSVFSIQYNIKGDQNTDEYLSMRNIV